VSQFFKLNTAKTYDDYRNGLLNYDCPAQNFVFATVAGDVAIRVQGKFPIRKGDEGRYFRDGSQSSNAWNEWIPADEIPQMHNPKRGFVASANQHSTTPNYKYYAPWGDWDQYRGRRVALWLQQMKHATVDSMKMMQTDNFSHRAHDALPIMLKLLDRTGLSTAEQVALSSLENWDFRYNKGLVAPTMFEIWLDSTYVHTWDEIPTVNYLRPELWRSLQLLEREPNSNWFDVKNTPAREDARQIVTRSFREMVQQMTTESAALKADWAVRHAFTLNHIARIAPFSRKNVQAGGHRSALNAMNGSHGPSWRMIVDMSGGKTQAIGVYPGGQSGNPGSHYYENMVDAWVGGQYYDLPLWLAATEVPAEKIKFRQSLRP
jgi:penicillin G amidase